MDDGSVLMAALHARPADDLTWMAFADHLEETGRAEQGELARLVALIRIERGAPANLAREERIRALLAANIRPFVPTITNSLGMTFALIPPGTFPMGSPRDEPGRYADEEPIHDVTLCRPYYLGIYPVTQEQFQTVMGRNPSSFSETGPDRETVLELDTRSFPVESVTWDEAVEFCTRSNELSPERKAKRTYRLPSEAEWERACRGGIETPTAYQFGHAIQPQDARHDFQEGLRETGEVSELPYHAYPARVGAHRPNAFGLYDMHGNVWEFCNDWFEAGYYRVSPAVDPPGPETGDSRVLRGGSWYSRPSVCRTACRNPVANPNTAGFRVVLEHRA